MNQLVFSSQLVYCSFHVRIFPLISFWPSRVLPFLLFPSLMVIDLSFGTLMPGYSFVSATAVPFSPAVLCLRDPTVHASHRDIPILPPSSGHQVSSDTLSPGPPPAQCHCKERPPTIHRYQCILTTCLYQEIMFAAPIGASPLASSYRLFFSPSPRFFTPIQPFHMIPGESPYVAQLSCKVLNHLLSPPRLGVLASKG